MKKQTLMVLVMLLASCAMVFAGGSQEAKFPDPEKTITIVCPQAAGGSTDMIFRTLAEEMKKVSGQNFIVTNITGASTATGTNEVLNAAADGYTLLAGGTHTVGATLQGLTKGTFELDTVAGLNWDPFIIACRNDKDWKTFDDLVKYAKAHPGEVTFGNAGMGGATGIACVGLNLAFDKCFNVTPFNGGADLIASVRGGHCDIGVFSQSEVVSNADAFRPLVILGDEHSLLDSLKSVPTLKEAGYGNISVPGGSFRAVMVKKGTPAATQKWLADTIKKAFESSTFQTFMKNNGIIPALTTLDAANKYMDDIVKDYEPILKEAGLYKVN